MGAKEQVNHMRDMLPVILLNQQSITILLLKEQIQDFMMLQKNSQIAGLIILDREKKMVRRSSGDGAGTGPIWAIC